MIVKFLLACSATLILTSASAQEKLYTKQSKVSEAVAFDTANYPGTKILDQSVSLSKDYYPLFDKYPVANAVVLQRPQKGELPLYISYFYTPADSMLRFVIYDWEKDMYGNFFKKQEMWKAEAKRFTAYNKEYERIRTALISEFGTPTKKDTVAKQISSDGGGYLTRETVWESADVHAELDMVFAPSTYRVRLVRYWKK